MSSLIVSFAWILSVLLLVVWLRAGWGIARGSILERPPDGVLPSVMRRRVLLPFWLAAGVAAFWGVPLHTVTVGSFPDLEARAAPAETTHLRLRAPFVVRSSTTDRDAAGGVLRAERRSTIQLPLVPLIFLGGLAALARRASTSPGGARGLAALALLATTAAGCGDTPGEPRPVRAIEDVRWDTLFHVESTLEDSLLFRVSRLAADAEGISVLDDIGARVARFRWDGGLLWYAGRRGGGPGELGQGRDLRLDDRGTSWVLDPANRRIGGFDREGRPAGEVHLRSVPSGLDQFVPGPGGETFFGAAPDDGSLHVVEIDRSGVILDSARLVIPGLEHMLSLGLDGWVGSAPGDERWGYAFASGDGLLRFRRGRSQGARSLFPDAIPFPEIEETVSRSGLSTTRTLRITRRTYGAAAVAASDGRAYVLLPDEERRYTIVDVYDLDSGTYLESLRLPRPASRLAVEGPRLLLGANDPHPLLLALQRRP